MEELGIAELLTGTEPDAEPWTEELPMPGVISGPEVGEGGEVWAGVARPVGLLGAPVDMIVTVPVTVSETEPVSTAEVVSAGTVVTPVTAERVVGVPSTGGMEIG